ncbi:hypothetical protein ACFQX6_66930 [Streptosporangium lutulentum]
MLLADDVLDSVPRLRQEVDLGRAAVFRACGAVNEAIALLIKVRESDTADLQLSGMSRRPGCCHSVTGSEGTYLALYGSPSRY